MAKLQNNDNEIIITGGGQLFPQQPEEPQPPTPPIVEEQPPTDIVPELPPILPPKAEVTLIRPHRDPINSFRATKVSDTYTMTPELSDGVYVYNLGIPAIVQTKKYSIQNNCFYNSLTVDVIVPEFMVVDVAHAIVLPKTVFTFEVSFNEDDVRRAPPTSLEQDFIVEVVINNIHGPVYVDKTMTDPHDPNLPVDQLPNIIPPPLPEQPPVVTPALIPTWRNGVTGELLAGSPPSGWITHEDGAAYPPEEAPVIDQTLRYKDGTTGQIVDGTPPPGWVVEDSGEIAPFVGGPDQKEAEIVTLNQEIALLNAQLLKAKKRPVRGLPDIISKAAEIERLKTAIAALEKRRNGLING